MPLFHIRHRTHYIYSSLVIDSANQVKLYPINDECQKVSEHRLVVSANPIVHTISDYFGNRTGFFTVLFPHKELSIDSLLEVEMFAKPQPVKTLDPSEVWKQILGEAVQLRYHDFLKAEEAESKQEIQQAIHEILGKVHPLDTIIDLSDYIMTTSPIRKV